MNVKFCFLILYLDYVNSVDSYRFLKLYDREVCPHADSIIFKPIDKMVDRRVRLHDGKDAAVVVEQSFDHKYFKRRNNEIKCNFKVDARAYNTGLFAVIRRLNLRRGNDVLCRDYIQFEYDNDTYSEKICGNVTSSNIVGVREGKGILKVELYIDTRYPLASDEESVEFSVVFTGYSDCDSTRIPCNPDDQTSCISKEFQNDHIHNCPDPCLDEGGCVETPKRHIIDTSNIVISAITSLIFSLIIFGSCLWLCWKYRECTDDRERDQLRQDRQAHIELSANASRSPANVGGHASAPPLAHAASLEKQDLPPAYDTLFPAS